MHHLRRLIIVSSTILLALLPFQTLFTVWLATNFGHLYFWTAWKEILVAVITICGALILLKDKSLRQKFLSKTYNKLAIGYVVLGVTYLLIQTIQQPDFSALVGFAIDFRFILVFLGLQLASPSKATIQKMLIVIGAILGSIALLQIFLLPTNTLTFFGYDKPGVNTSGIPPAYHAVASGSSLNRAQATLRGPNELGAYLILPILLSGFAYAKTKRKKFIGLGALSVAGLIFSYSRSAFIGLVFAVGLYLIFGRPKKVVVPRKQLLILVVLGICLAGAIGWKTNTIQTVVLHNNPEVEKVQSNEGHIELSQKAVKDMVNNPIGHGLGQAGPSSALGNPDKAVISENYFLQVGLEMGILGFLLLLAIHGYVLKALYDKRHDNLGYPILLTFIALIITNMLLHTWADEAVAITVWAVIAVLLSLKSDSKLKSS